MNSNRVEIDCNGFPYINSEVYKTNCGTNYLKEPGVAIVSMPQISLAQNVDAMLLGFDKELEFEKYTYDDSKRLEDGTQLCKFAGQLCYASFGPNRSLNSEAEKYFTNIRSSGHGSVLEHANYSFLLWGIDRSVSHELVRHRAGMAYSQLSQRYVDGKVLRFVERPEWQDEGELHRMFEERIDSFADQYNYLAETLAKKQLGNYSILSSENKRGARKKVNQAARSVLPNETETILVATGNVRAIRHVIEMRANKHTDILIRESACRMYECINNVAPIMFNDYELVYLPDGTRGIETECRKV